MKVKSMTFAEESDGEMYPDTVTVTMTIEDALWVAEIAGQQRGESPHIGIYSCLSGDVFNRYWENGVIDAMIQHPVETPPIVYDED